MRDCPSCGSTVDGLSCGRCGYSEGGKAQPVRDPLWWCCSHEMLGTRCNKPGTVTQNVQGTERWFCHEHAFPASRGEKSAPSEDTAWKIQKFLTGFGQPKGDGRDWARRILKRQQNGDRVPELSLEFARAALGIRE